MDNAPNQLPQARSRHKRSRGIVGIGMVIVVGILAYLFEPTLLDSIRASQFTPSPQIAAVAKRISLTPRAERTFYATNPAVENRAKFNQSCQSSERTAAILGCYASEKIYIYNVEDKSLDGAMAVTAAHELLHAAYERLNIFEKSRVDAMVNAEYQTIKNDPTIVEEMQYYRTAEPGEEINELHSIIGTTIKDLPPDLEDYYGRYFSDRQSIVAMNTAYTAVFDKLNAQALALEKKINAEAVTIRAESASYNADLAQLNADINDFNARANGGYFSSQYAFMSERNALVARADALTVRQERLNSRIDSYNADITEYNKLGLRAKQLNASINGVEAPDSI